jgi:hypothetical protein
MICEILQLWFGAITSSFNVKKRIDNGPICPVTATRSERMVTGAIQFSKSDVA